LSEFPIFAGSPPATKPFTPSWGNVVGDCTWGTIGTCFITGDGGGTTTTTATGSPHQQTFAKRPFEPTIASGNGGPPTSAPPVSSPPTQANGFTGVIPGEACCELSCRINHSFQYNPTVPSLILVIDWSKESKCIPGPCPGGFAPYHPPPQASRLTDKENQICRTTENGITMQSAASWIRYTPMDEECPPAPTGNYFYDTQGAAPTTCPESKSEGHFTIEINGNTNINIQTMQGCNSKYGGWRSGAAPLHGATGVADLNNGWKKEENLSKRSVKAYNATAAKILAKGCSRAAEEFYAANEETIIALVKGGGETPAMDTSPGFAGFKAAVVCRGGQYKRNTGRSIRDPQDMPAGATLGGLFGAMFCGGNSGGW